MNPFLSLTDGIIYGLFALFPGSGGASLLTAIGSYEKTSAVIALRKYDIPRSFYETDEPEEGEAKRKRRTALIMFSVGLAVGIAAAVLFVRLLLDSHPLPTKLAVAGITAGGIPIVFRSVLKEGGKWLYNLPLAIIPFAIIAAVAVFSGNKTDAVTLTQSVSPTNSSVTVVTLINESDKEIEGWKVGFPEGKVDAAGGAQMFYEQSVGDRVSAFMRKSSVERNANAFSGEAESQNKVIPPRSSVSFTYVSRLGTRLKLDVQVSYRFSANLVASIVLAGLCAGIAMSTPGLSGYMAFSMFGVAATLESAADGMKLSVLIPCAVAVLLGMFLGARIFTAAVSSGRKAAFTALCGFMLGGVVSALPKLSEIEIGFDFIVGVCLFVLCAAISAALGMERKSNDDLLEISPDLK